MESVERWGREALLSLSELLLFAGRVFPRHPPSLAGALWLRNTECKTEEMTRQSLPSSSGPNFLQEPILDLRLSPQLFTQETPTPGDRKWLSARQKGSQEGRCLSTWARKVWEPLVGDYLNSRRIKGLGICCNLGFSGIPRF